MHSYSNIKKTAIKKNFFLNRIRKQNHTWT
jgi:hypothetical protein